LTIPCDAAALFMKCVANLGSPDRRSVEVGPMEEPHDIITSQTTSAEKKADWLDGEDHA
jgi:hypothetical protein